MTAPRFELTSQRQKVSRLPTEPPGQKYALPTLLDVDWLFIFYYLSTSFQNALEESLLSTHERCGLAQAGEDELVHGLSIFTAHSFVQNQRAHVEEIGGVLLPNHLRVLEGLGMLLRLLEMNKGFGWMTHLL